MEYIEEMDPDTPIQINLLYDILIELKKLNKKKAI